MIESNIKQFRYKLIWKKNVPTGMNGKNRPMKYYEEICVFNNGSNIATYNPIPKERVGIGKLVIIIIIIVEKIIILNWIRNQRNMILIL